MSPARSTALPLAPAVVAATALGGGIAISNQAFVHDGSFSPLAGTTTAGRRYLRLTVTGNTGRPAGRLSEFEAYTS